MLSKSFVCKVLHLFHALLHSTSGQCYQSNVDNLRPHFGKQVSLPTEGVPDFMEYFMAKHGYRDTAWERPLSPLHKPMLRSTCNLFLRFKWSNRNHWGSDKFLRYHRIVYWVPLLWNPLQKYETQMNRSQRDWVLQTDFYCHVTVSLTKNTYFSTKRTSFQFPRYL